MPRALSASPRQPPHPRRSFGSLRRPLVARRWRLRAVALAVVLLVAFQLSFRLSPTDTRLAFSNALGNHMVLQRDAPVVVWGTARLGAVVSCRLDGAPEKGAPVVDLRDFRDGEADSVYGVWEVQLEEGHAADGVAHEIVCSTPAPPHSFRLYSLLFPSRLAQEIATLTDVRFGDVFLCSGQSNMAFGVAGSFEAGEAAATAHTYTESLRLFTVGVPTPGEALSHAARARGSRPAAAASFARVVQPWGVPSRNSVSSGTHLDPWAPFSAVCWSFGASLADLQPSPGASPPPVIGLVVAAVRGSCAERWLPPGVAAAAGCDAAPHAAAAGSSLWDAMVAPLSRLAFAGVVWYQGESNVGHESERNATTHELLLASSPSSQALMKPRAAAVRPHACPTPGATCYSKLLASLFSSWQSSLRAPSLSDPPRASDENAEAAERTTNAPAVTRLPFFVAQLAPYPSGRGAGALPELRDVQLSTHNPIENGVHVVPLLGCGDLESPHRPIHPRAKREVGARLAAAAAAALYDRPPRAAPAFASASEEPPAAAATVAADDGASGTPQQQHPTRRVAVCFTVSSPLAGGISIDASAVCPPRAADGLCAGFEVLGGGTVSEQRWAPAEVEPRPINASCVALRVRSVPIGEAIWSVRYGWADWPLAVVIGGAGDAALPAWPFSPKRLS